MRERNHLIGLLFLVALAPGALRAETLRIAVVDLALESGVAESTRDLLYERLLMEVARHGECEVLGKTDIETMIGLEEERQKLGCLDQASCIAEIGGALGVQQIISGNLGKIGESLLINLKRIDVRQAKAVGRVSRRFKGGSAEQILDDLPDIVAELLDATTPGEPPGDAPGGPSVASSTSFWGWVTLGVGGAALIAGTGLGAHALVTQQDLEDSAYDAGTYQDTVDSVDSSALAADVLFGVGAAAAVVGVILLLIGDDEPAPTEPGPAPALIPTVGPNGLGLQGRF